MNLNFNAELGQLFVFTSKVATAIRMNSPYNGRYKNNPNYSDDVMWLSDCLHHFERLGYAIQSGDIDQIETACEMTLSVYKRYDSNDTSHKSAPLLTFSKQTLFCLDEARGALTNIQNKIIHFKRAKGVLEDFELRSLIDINHTCELKEEAFQEEVERFIYTIRKAAKKGRKLTVTPYKATQKTSDFKDCSTGEANSLLKKFSDKK